VRPGEGLSDFPGLRQVRQRRKIVERIGKIVDRVGEQGWLVERVGKIWQIGFGEIERVRQGRQVRIRWEGGVKGVG
jgi:hypothetical protein